MCAYAGARVWVRYAQVHHEIGARGYAAQATISLVSLEAGFRLGMQSAVETARSGRRERPDALAIRIQTKALDQL